MSVMSQIEASFCRSVPWRGFARRVVLPWALGDTAIDGDVLEIGGGSGAMAVALLARHPAVRLAVTDLDPAMVAMATRQLAPHGDRADVLEADATGLPFDDASFDVVCSWLMLHHTLHWEQVLAEATRVLRPGGTLLAYDLADTPGARLTHRLDRSAHRLIRPEPLRRELQRLDLDTVTVETHLAGTLLRFTARHAVDARTTAS
jgi:ubiquinone/menaquinone biosynthesis C-methylase UbiE